MNGTEKSEKRVDHMDTVAKRKMGNPPGWEPYRYESINGGVLIGGGVPSIITRGPNKGRKRWTGRPDMVVVTSEEIDSERQRFERDDHKCYVCSGTGKDFASWHYQKGMEYKVCARCNGSGIPPA